MTLVVKKTVEKKKSSKLEDAEKLSSKFSTEPHENLSDEFVNDQKETDNKVSSNSYSEKNLENPKFKKREGTAGIDGYFYEIDLLLLGMLRGCRDTDKFYMASNMDGAGAFDDVVIRYWKSDGTGKSETIFLQSKHVANSKRQVTIENFMNMKSDDGKFYLIKYFIDYLKIREKFDCTSNDPIFNGNFTELDLRFTIYTNAILSEQFKKGRYIDVHGNIFSSKSKENKDKAFKFNLNENSDIIKVLENFVCEDRVKSLAKALVSCILGKLNYNNMMSGNVFFLTYHVFLSKNVIDVNEERKKGKKLAEYREGKINHRFLEPQNKDPLKEKLRKAFINEYTEKVVFSEKAYSELGDENKRNHLLCKLAKSLKSSRKVDDNIIMELKGSVIILDTESRKLKFSDESKLKDGDAREFIRELKIKVHDLETYKFDIPVKKINKLVKKETLKLHINFGNISPNVKNPEYLIKKFIELFKEYKNKSVIKIDDSMVGHGKKLTNRDIKTFANLVGTLLIFDEEKKMLKFSDEDSLSGDILKLIKKLKTTALTDGLVVEEYRFDMQVKNFPRDSLVIEDKDTADFKEFFSRLEILTGQASDRDLEEIIKDEMRDLYKLTKDEVEESFLKIRSKTLNFWKNGDDFSYYLEKNDDLWTNIVKFNIKFEVKEPVASFSGRIEALDKLHEALQNGGEGVISRMACVTGLSGVGKSELARKYISEHDSDYDGNIIWINAEDYNALTNSFYGLANKLGISTKYSNGEEKDIKSVVQEVYNFIANRKSLFIFDNAEKSEDMKQFLTPILSYNDKLYVLITSFVAIEEWENWGVKEGMTLDVFTDEEAISFVKRALRDCSEDNKIRELAVDVLYKFPLALQQAVAYISWENKKTERRGQGEYTISIYLEDYKEETYKLLNSEKFRTLDNDYTKTTLTTWKITVEKIKGDKKYGPLALQILDIMAYFAPYNIPVESFLQKLTENEKKLWKAVELLDRYSMIKLKRGKVDIHGLVQQVTRINLKDQNREEETLKKVLELIKERKKAIGSHNCIFYPCTKAGKLSNIEMHATYVWSYANKYSQLIEDFYSTYGENGNEPINLFAISGKKEAIECILNNMQEDRVMERLNSYNEVNYAPIHSAAFCGHKEIVKYFIEEKGISVDFFTVYYQVTPTFVATLGNQLHTVQYLVGDRGADPNIGDKYAIHYAAYFARKSLLEYLVENGADILVKDSLCLDHVIHFALNHLRMCGCDTIYEIIEYLLKKNSAFAKCCNSLGMTALHVAARYDVVKCIEMLLGCDADINAKTHIAEPQGKYKKTQYKDIDGYDKGYTPLHIAAEKDFLKTAKLLLRHGAVYNVFNDEGRTPLDIAKLGSDVKILLTSINESFNATKRGKTNKLDSLLIGKDSDVLEAILHARNNERKTLKEVAISYRDKDIENLLAEKLISV